MAGIYLHIPFCKRRCIYCDFFSTTQSEQTDRYIEALCSELEQRKCIYCDFFSTTQSEQTDRYVEAFCSELEQRKDYLEGEDIETVYLGGGTPSQLQEKHFERIFSTLYIYYNIRPDAEITGTPSQLQEKHFERIFSTLYIYYNIRPDAEITIEANPDDLNEEYVKMLRTFPFNRLSMGIQTFNDKTLQLLHRRHTAQQAIEAFDRCRESGFANLSIDLMYGLPGETCIPNTFPPIT